MKFALFLGCLIPFRLPSLEITARKVLNRLGVELEDVPDFSCCPNTIAVEPVNDYYWYFLAARNLALAEMRGLDILCLCSGCSESLKRANFELKKNHALGERVNSKLSEIGLKYNGNVEVKHFVEVLIEMGLDTIREKIIYPLHGLKAACHYGCHLLRPSEVILFDNPLKPVSLDRLVQILGAETVDYENKMLCCGSGLSLVKSDEALLLSKRKLDEVKNKADCLVVVCPSCFQQYDSVQKLMKEKPDVPVFYYLELLGLALGIEPESLGLSTHKISVSNLVNRINERIEALKGLSEIFDLTVLKNCARCGACSSDCPVADENFNPHQIVKMLLEGKMREVLDAGEFWRCTECYTCHELCPQNMGLIEIFSKLKSLVSEKELIPEDIRSQVANVLNNGFAIPPSQALRKRFDLPEPPKPNLEKIKKLVKSDV
nr:heterodisulfide reductase-related iron-sulfur binding cluster [Candidatus Freyarchaeota archaeon]